MTGQAIGEVLAFGVGVALSPLAVVAIVIMLVSPGRARSAWIFGGAWPLSLGLACGLVVLLADGADAGANGGTATWVSIVKIVLGVLLVVFGVRRWRGREREDTPGWMRQLDGITSMRAAGLAVLFTVIKPKNLLLTIGAGVAVAQTGAGPAGQVLAVVVFALLGSAGLLAPLAIHVLMPTRGQKLLVELRDWMVRENATVIAVLSLVIAAKLLGDALISLTG